MNDVPAAQVKNDDMAKAPRNATMIGNKKIYIFGNDSKYRVC